MSQTKKCGRNRWASAVEMRVAAALSVLVSAICILSPAQASIAGVAGNDVIAVDENGHAPQAVAQLRNVTFPVGSYIIPMDDKQTDVVRAFGMVHGLLMAGATINRIIQPLPLNQSGPDITVYTQTHPSSAQFSGGPIIVFPSYQSTVNTVKTSFPTVSFERTTQAFSCSHTYVINHPTKILVVNGFFDWGDTKALLSEMGIPYDLTTTGAISSDPSAISGYNLIVDDCPGWMSGMPQGVIDALTAFVEDGNEIIFTDIAGGDFQKMPWGSKMTIIEGSVQEHYVANCTFNAYPEFPGQYYGKQTVSIYQKGGCKVGIDPIDYDVRVMTECSDYEGNSTRRILAAYFTYGTKGGIVEFFAYHPPEQDAANTNDTDSKRLASFLYGNKFIHYLPVDAGVSPASSASPQTIYLQGTGPTQSSEEATVKLAIKAVGADVIPESKMSVNWETMPYIGIVAGSFTDGLGNPRAPDSQVLNPNSSTSISWDVGFIVKNSYWNVTFKVTSSGLGKVYINAAGKCNVTFFDYDGKFRSQNLMLLSVTVTDGLLVPESATAIIICAVANAVLLAAVAAVPRRPKGAR